MPFISFDAFEYETINPNLIFPQCNALICPDVKRRNMIAASVIPSETVLGMPQMKMTLAIAFRLAIRDTKDLFLMILETRMVVMTMD